VCEINDPGHTCDEYLVLLTKLGMTRGAALDRHIDSTSWFHLQLDRARGAL
jgi:hypothetical protein